MESHSILFLIGHEPCTTLRTVIFHVYNVYVYV